MEADCLIADKAYDTNAIIDKAVSQGMEVVIPPKKNRKVQREYDKYLYELRHLVENTFLHLKQWRGIATRYAKNAASFLAAVHIKCFMMWARLI
jgi:transposase